MNPKLNKSRSNCRAMGMVISRDGNMTYNSAVHHRRSIRLQEYDYAQAGAYFVTICTHNHQPIFGKIELDSIGQSASAQNGRGQPVGAGLAPAQNGKGQPAPAQNGKGQPAPAQNNKGQPRGLPLQDSNNVIIGPDIGQPRGSGQPRGLPLLNEFGQIALEQWHKLSDRFPTIDLNAFVVMPNHVHGIIFITENGPQQQRGQSRDGQPENVKQPQGFGQPQGLPLPMRTTLGDVVGAYKSLVSNECLKIYKSRNETMGKLWQRNYYEHIIRDEKSFENIVSYIENNPSTWQQDELFRGEML